MPNEPLNHITKSDLDNANTFASTAMFSILKDDMSDAKKKEILSSIFGIRNAESGEEADALILMGGRNRDFIAAAPGDPGVITELEEPRKQTLMPGDYRVYTNPLAKRPLDEFVSSMKEFSQALDRKLKNTTFLNPSEADFFYAIKGITDILANGESVSERAKKYTQMAYVTNIFIKFDLPAGSVSVDKSGKIQLDTNGFKDYKRMLQNLDETGMIQAMAGAFKVSDMQERYEKTGEISREELIAEYEMQAKRMEKALSLSRETYDKINTGGEKCFVNKYEELTNGDRGYVFVKEDAVTRAKLLKNGYPAEDLTALSEVQRAISELKNNAENNKDEKRYQQAYDILKTVWEEIYDKEVQSEEDRLQKLEALKAATAQAWVLHVGDDNQMEVADWKLGQRLREPLKTYEKALLAKNAEEMFNQLDAADPGYISSSSQFSELKRKLKALKNLEVEHRGHLDRCVDEYRIMAKQVAEAAAKYLRFKAKQMDGSKRGHKRSETEAKRVRVVDAILTSLNEREIPGVNNYNMVEGTVPGARRPSKKERILDPDENKYKNSPVYQDTKRLADMGLDNLPRNVKNYIKLHTGKGAINGTLEEMKLDFTKVAAALHWQKEHPGEELNVDAIHALMPRMEKLYQISRMSEEELVNGLCDKESVELQCKNTLKSLWANEKLFKKIRNNNGIEEQESYYQGSVTSARIVYRYIADPHGKSDEYRKMFAAVKGLAHLDKNGESFLNRKQLVNKMTQWNTIAIQNALDILERTRGKGPEGVGAMSVLSTVGLNVQERGKRLIQDAIFRVNELNGTDPDSRNYLLPKNFDCYAIAKAVQNDPTVVYVRDFDKKYYEELKESLKPKENYANDENNIAMKNIEARKLTQMRIDHRVYITNKQVEGQHKKSYNEAPDRINSKNPNLKPQKVEKPNPDSQVKPKLPGMN